MLPVHLYAPIPPLYICMFSLYYMFSKCHGDFGEHLYTPYVFGGISTSVRHFCVCQYIHCLSVHNSHTSCSSSLWVASLLEWMPMYVCYASYCRTFLCSVFIMSQASTTMATTTTPLVTAVCSSTSSLLSMVTMAPSLMGLSVTSGHYDVVLPPPLTPRHSGDVVGLGTVPQ